MLIEKTFPIALTVLDNGLKHAQHLWQLLQHEADLLLEAQRADQLKALAEQKQRCVESLTQVSKQIAQILASEQLPHDAQGIADYFDRAASCGLPARQGTQKWQTLAELSKNCRDLNEKNGVRIEMLTRYAQRRLQLLKGRTETSITYGRDGITRSAAASHTLVTV